MRHTSDDTGDLPLQALRLLIDQQREDDPLIGAKLGSKVALELLIEQLTTVRGVHAETLMATAGMLVGQSVQASLWAEARQAGQRRIPHLQLVRCHDDSCHLVGRPINSRLMEGHGSPWSLLCEAAHQEGCETLPKAEQLLLDGIARLGTPAFGHPGVPPCHAPQRLEPAEQAALWRSFHPLVEGCSDAPAEWPLLCGLLAVRAMRLVKTALSPDLAVRLAMDSAIDAARLPLADDVMAA